MPAVSRERSASQNRGRGAAIGLAQAQRYLRLSTAAIASAQRPAYPRQRVGMMEKFWEGVSFTYDGRGRPAWHLKDGRMITAAEMLQRERLFRAGHDPDADYVPDVDGRDATLGPIIAAERATRDMSQRDLAAVAGVSQSMVARMERGMREPSWRTFRLLLEAMLLVPIVDVRERDEGTGKRTNDWSDIWADENRDDQPVRPRPRRLRRSRSAAPDACCRSGWQQPQRTRRTRAPTRRVRPDW